MRTSHFQTILFLLLILFFSSSSQAIPQWNIIPNESSIIFTGTQNDAPASGRFKKFTGDISMDPQQITTGKVRLVINMNSISTSYSEFASTLMTSDWFDVKVFPQAIFTSSQFKKLGEDQYQAIGTLTIRDKTLPITLGFTAKSLSPTKIRVTGNTTLKRTMFGIGKGEWADTNAVKDDVKVEFILTAEEKKE